jgi:putative ABC transport system ATP-binding protein
LVSSARSVGSQSSVSTILQVEHLSQQVQTPAGTLSILHDLNFSIAQGEQVAITGRSGSGKSTLLGLLAGLDRATQGELWLCGQSLHQMNEDERAKVRRDLVGFVFQSFQLLPHLSALDNVLLPLTIAGGIDKAQATARAKALLERVGLAARMAQTPPCTLRG